MSWLKTIVQEIWGLFVDDGAFAVAILGWLGVVWLLVGKLGVAVRWGGVVLFAGLAVILIESALRYSRAKASAERR